MRTLSSAGPLGIKRLKRAGPAENIGLSALTAQRFLRQNLPIADSRIARDPPPITITACNSAREREPPSMMLETLKLTPVAIVTAIQSATPAPASAAPPLPAPGFGETRASHFARTAARFNTSTPRHRRDVSAETRPDRLGQCSQFIYETFLCQGILRPMYQRCQRTWPCLLYGCDCSARNAVVGQPSPSSTGQITGAGADCSAMLARDSANPFR
jgi:hypothetical protein